jgi:hypothetical protein
MPPSTGCRSASLRGKATRDLRSFRLAGRGAALPEAVDDWAPAGLDRIRRPVADALVAIVQIPGHSWHGALQVTRGGSRYLFLSGTAEELSMAS